MGTPRQLYQQEDPRKAGQFSTVVGIVVVKQLTTDKSLNLGVYLRLGSFSEFHMFGCVRTGLAVALVLGLD